jgi:2-iminoacetate synthase ThiH
MAGSRTPEALSTADIERLIRAAGREPVERDTFYREIKGDGSSGVENSRGRGLGDPSGVFHT